MKMRKIILLCCFNFAWLAFLAAQINVPFDTMHWDIRSQKHEFIEYKGQAALMMKGGIALLKDAQFKNGTIEWDMAFPKERGFAGVRFRIKDLRNMEEFYFRPHQSGQADANQYCPVTNGVSSWQLYHGPEYAVPYEYNFNKWFHVKLVVADRRAELYIDNMRTPVLHIPYLKREPMEGGLMVYGSLVPAYFANFSYTPQDRPKLMNAPLTEKPMDPLTVAAWSVSNAFPDSQLKGVYHLADMKDKDWKWKSLSAENSGTANLAIVSDFDRVERNTVFAKLILDSEKDQMKALQIGFSDKAKVYCNGQILFGGNDSYRTRDFRYLGTIGYFDTVYLPLKKGRNEVFVAITEGFGGWGIKGKLENMKDIRIIE